VAWERPNEFSRVHVMDRQLHQHRQRPTVRAGGHNYEAMVRKTPKKPIRVFCRTARTISTTRTATGRSRIRRSAKSLAYAGYDYRFEFGHGFHQQPARTRDAPDTLRWLWRGYQALTYNR
jgi:enterochelin esterase family protein